MKNWMKTLPIRIITEISNQKRVDPLLVMAMVSIESSGDTNAIRYESHYKWIFQVGSFARRNKITEETEKRLQMSSMGLLQIMGANARVYGLKGPLTDLLKPEIGLLYGIEHLTKLIDKYDSIEDAISSYNQGSPRKKENGDYQNQEYVDKILNRLNYLKGI